MSLTSIIIENNVCVAALYTTLPTHFVLVMVLLKSKLSTKHWNRGTMIFSESHQKWWTHHQDAFSKLAVLLCGSKASVVSSPISFLNEDFIEEPPGSAYLHLKFHPLLDNRILYVFLGRLWQAYAQRPPHESYFPGQWKGSIFEHHWKFSSIWKIGQGPDRELLDFGSESFNSNSSRNSSRWLLVVS